MCVCVSAFYRAHFIERMVILPFHSSATYEYFRSILKDLPTCPTHPGRIKRYKANNKQASKGNEKGYKQNSNRCLRGQNPIRADKKNKKTTVSTPGECVINLNEYDYKSMLLARPYLSSNIS